MEGYLREDKEDSDGYCDGLAGLLDSEAGTETEHAPEGDLIEVASVLIEELSEEVGVSGSLVSVLFGGGTQCPVSGLAVS
jgi:hypothetical protein